MTLHLADRSALEMARRSNQAALHLRVLGAARQLATCQIIAMEVMYSARNYEEAKALRARLASMVQLGTTGDALNRAVDVQFELSARGRHRLPMPDLMIAATAEQHGATVLHYDKDFDLIAELTGQPVRWVIPRGSV